MHGEKMDKRSQSNLKSELEEAKIDKNWFTEIPSWKSHHGMRNSSLLCFFLQACHCKIRKLLGTVNPPPVSVTNHNLFTFQVAKEEISDESCTYLSKETNDLSPKPEAKPNRRGNTEHFHTGRLESPWDQSQRSWIWRKKKKDKKEVEFWVWP